MVELSVNMILPDLKYLVFNTFEQIKQTDFFSKHEILLGKSLFDFSIKNTDDIQKALENI